MLDTNKNSAGEVEIRIMTPSRDNPRRLMSQNTDYTTSDGIVGSPALSNQTPAENRIHTELTEDEDESLLPTKRRIKFFFIHCCKYQIISLVSALLFLLVMEQHITILYCFLFWWVVDLFNLVLACKFENEK